MLPAFAVSRDHKPDQTDERQRIEDAGGFVMWAGKIFPLFFSHFFILILESAMALIITLVLIQVPGELEVFLLSLVLSVTGC